jgi:methylmalonyl-CoA mutase
MLKKEKLFDLFPPVTTEAWMELIRSDLKGADFSKKLVWKTNNGFDINPFYRTEDTEKLPFTNILPGQFPWLRGRKKENNEWLIRQNLEVTDYAAANDKALSILNRGIDSLGFVISDPGTITADNFRTLLKDIHPEAIELNFLSNGKAIEILEILSLLCIENETDRSKVKGAIEADPLGRLMTNGTLCLPVEAGLDYLASLTSASEIFPLLRTLHINASAFGNAGASLTEELAYGISMGAEYMSQLTSRGISASVAASKIRFSFSTGSDYFPEIAKLRAARLLWSVVLKGFNIADAAMEIHSVTASWNKSLYDPYVNMLRSTTEAMSAILGGTDSLTVEPFDKVFCDPNDFSERIARNQQLILKEESYFDKVADPSAGSYYIENITKLIADKAWQLFTGIEEKGGFLKSLLAGEIQKNIEESAVNRRRDYALRKSVLLGTSQYPNGLESFPGSADFNKLRNKPVFDDDLTVQPVIPFRVSEAFDAIRIAVDQAARRPTVFLLPLGNVVMRNARAQFSAGFFSCAGYSIIHDSSAFSSAEDGIAAALASEADIVVICSSDEEYASVAPQICLALKEQALIVIAGNPACAEELKKLGLEFFIHMKSDVPAVLSMFNGLLGIKI